MATRSAPTSPLDALELPTLTARSVLGSALIGTKRGLSSRTLTALASLFGIAPTTTRVALSRMVAAGEVAASDNRYKVAGSFQRRQARQTEAVEPHLAPWDGTWDIWIVRASRSNAAERIALRAAMTELRIAEHREGVWMRPANLPPTPAADAQRVAEAQAERFVGRPAREGPALAASLWDLEGWATQARALLDATAYLRPEAAAGADTAMAPSFLVLVAIVHHLDTDPLLPAELLPADWPGSELRAEFASFEASWQELLATWRRSLR